MANRPEVPFLVRGDSGVFFKLVMTHIIDIELGIGENSEENRGRELNRLASCVVRRADAVVVALNTRRVGLDPGNPTPHRSNCPSDTDSLEGKWGPRARPSSAQPITKLQSSPWIAPLPDPRRFQVTCIREDEGV